MVVYVFPKFRQNLRSSAIFRVDLAWNYPYSIQCALIFLYIICTSFCTTIQVLALLKDIRDKYKI